jgi:hypothetical protein
MDCDDRTCEIDRRLRDVLRPEGITVDRVVEQARHSAASSRTRSTVAVGACVAALVVAAGAGLWRLRSGSAGDASTAVVISGAGNVVTIQHGDTRQTVIAAESLDEDASSYVIVTTSDAGRSLP